MWAYRLIRRFLRFVVSVFFRQVAVAGSEHIPDGGAVIFAGNHPNSLLDPVLILTTCGRVVRFAAKDVLFKSPPMAFVLGRLGAVPVARRSDHEGGPLDNQGSFDRLAQVLSSGEAMGIFPEGISHDDSQLARLKTGAARIALDVAARGVPVKIVPCGLTYVTRKRFRSRALVQYGPAIEVGATPVPDPRAAARALTDEIDRGLRALTVNAPDWETLRVLDAVRRLYQPPRISLPERIELARRFATVYPTVKEQPEVAALYARVEAWLARLDALGLTERDLARAMSPSEVALRVARQVALVLVWLPLAAPGILLHAPVVALISVAAPRLTPRKDVTATTKLVLGLLLAPLGALGAAGFIAWRFGGLAGAGALALLSLSGIATVRVLERGVRLKRLLASSARVLSLSAEVAELRAERAALEAEVAKAVEALRPAEMRPLFPKDAP